MKCPKCKNGEVKENINFKNKFFGFKKLKIVSTICPLCDFKNIHEFEMSKEDYEIEILHRTNLPKITQQDYNTRREER